MECNLLRYFIETHFFSGFAVQTEDPTSEKQVQLLQFSLEAFDVAK